MNCFFLDWYSLLLLICISCWRNTELAQEKKEMTIGFVMTCSCDGCGLMRLCHISLFIIISKAKFQQVQFDF